MQLNIATRESPLALWQANFVADQLRRRYPHLEIKLLPLTTRGDQLLGQPLAQIGGKNLFIKELEQALLDGRAQLAVHSLKDVGAQLAAPFRLAAILERENPYDALLAPNYGGLAALPAGARVGTCSLRRQLQLKLLRPDLELVNLRGNLQSRLAKLERGEFAAIVLAVSGLKRLGLGERISEQLPLLPAAGQGALAIETLTDSPAAALVAALNHEPTARCVLAERAVAARLGASCSVPLAVFADHVGAEIRLRALLGSLDGQKLLRQEITAPPAEIMARAAALAEEFLAQGAAAIIAGGGV